MTVYFLITGFQSLLLHHQGGIFFKLEQLRKKHQAQSAIV